MKYRFKTTPYKHQRKAIRKLISNGYGGALLMEPRTGKTKTTIDYLSMLNQAGRIDKAVIVCPARVMDVWIAEFARHSPRMVQVFVWDAKARRNAPLPAPSGAYDLQVVIVNYDAFSTPGRKLASGRRSKASGRFKFRQTLFKWMGDSCAGVLDESHKIKSPSGKAANMVVSTSGRFKYRVLLTGTVVTKAKRIHDIYMQWKWLNPARLEEAGLWTVQDVKDYTGVYTNRNGFPQWLREKSDNVTAVRHLIHQDAFAVKREECFDLPPAEDQIIKVDLTTSGRVYDDMAERMIAELVDKTKNEHTVEASIPLVLALRLAQITGGCATTDEGRIMRVGREKLNIMEELIEKAEAENEKLVIAARFKPDLSAIARIGRRMGIPTYELRGGVSRQQATANIRQFKDDEDCSLFIMQPSAGSLGIDLSSSAHVVWYSLTSSFVNWSQSNDRIALNPGMKTHTYLLARDTVDELLLESLKTDTHVSKLITTRPKSVFRGNKLSPAMRDALDIFQSRR